MPPPEETREVARAWLEWARGDLRAAESCREAGDVPKWIIGFHCQQAVEKVLKGFLVLAGEEPPKTHALLRLEALVRKAGQEPAVAARDLLPLLRFAVAERYPILSTGAAPCDVNALLATASLAVSDFESRLKLPASGD